MNLNCGHCGVEVVTRKPTLDVVSAGALRDGGVLIWAKREDAVADLDDAARDVKEIQRTLDTSTDRLDQGQGVFRDVLALPDEPEALYKRSGEHVRVILNSVFFSRLYVDGEKITGHEEREPFGALTDAYHVWIKHKDERDKPSFERPVGNVRTTRNAASPKRYGADLVRSTSSPADTFGVRGWSKTIMVGDTGIEPVTSSV